MKAENEDDLLSVAQIAAKLSVSEQTVWKKSKTSCFPKAVRIGRNVRWKRGQIETWINGLGNSSLGPKRK